MARATNLSEADCTRISEAVRVAEATTAGEIYVVVAGAAAQYHSIPILWAAIVALILPWLLHLLTDWSSGLILMLQVLTFVVLALALSLDRVRYRLVPPSIAAAAVRKAAQAQFLAHGVHLTTERTGILIYVALAERRVEIVADDGINEKVAQSELDQIADDVVGAAASGTLAQGLVAAVEDAGKLLSRHFPPPSININELPDRVVRI